MRFDTKVAFYIEKERKYNPRTSQYEGGSKLIATYMCNVTSSNASTQQGDFGKLLDDGKTIRAKSTIPAFDYCLIGDNQTRYRLNGDLGSLKIKSVSVEAEHE